AAANSKRGTHEEGRKNSRAHFVSLSLHRIFLIYKFLGTKFYYFPPGSSPYRSSGLPPASDPLLACPSARGDLAALQAKADSLASKLRQRQIELDAANDSLARQREENARLLALNADMARRLDACEVTRCSAERNGYAVQALQDQYRSAQERIRELEARVRAGLQDGSGLERRHADFVNRVIYQLGVGCAEDLDGLVNKVGELVKENVAMKGRIHGLTDRQSQLELDAKANRETIQRLLAEVSRNSSAAAAAGSHLLNGDQGARAEADRLRIERDDLQKQVQLLEMRVESGRKQLEATRADLQEREARLARLDCERREAAHSSRNSETQMHALLESLASMLSSAYCRVSPTEEAVKEKVRLMCREVKEHSASVAALEERVRTLTRQFEAQFETSRERDFKTRRVECDQIDLRERLRAMEGELAAADVIRDGLKADKEKFYKYMRRLAEALKMDRATADVGFDLLGEGLLARYLFTRCRALREQLESKDLHMELLRKKVAQLEAAAGAAGTTGGSGLSSYERERAYKLQRHLEKSQEMLDDARQEIARLRGQLLECNGLKATAIEQDRELACLETTMEKLERVRQKQAKRIAALKAEAEARDRDGGDRRGQTDGMSHEIRALRRALEEARRRERQLLEFRAAIARMLGLDAASLSIPDLDIIARLERLVQAQGGGAYAAFTPAERPLGGMEPSFQSGYSSGGAGATVRGRSPARVCPACRVARCQC
uniref:Coiled-coil domain-containing protein 170 n=1 Tax=Macrostomum lignano TaxID=282301 RepID=A0A1I8I2I0_9PLAT